jgi:SAM-dependent methyltransferase
MEGGQVIYLAQVLSELKELRCSVPATLIGGLVDRGFSDNDVDLLYSGLSLTHQKVAHSLSPELARRLHLVAEEEIGHQARPPKLLVGGALLWDYAQSPPLPGDEFTEQSTLRWSKGLEVEGRRILDVGCGDGFAMWMFSSLGGHPVAISASEEEVCHCRQQGLEAYLMDQNLLDFEDECFDIVWSHHTLEHSVAPILAIREAARVLKPGGILALTTGVGRAPGHHYRFDQTTLENMLLDSGFSLLRGVTARCGFSPEIHIKASLCVSSDLVGAIDISRPQRVLPH